MQATYTKLRTGAWGVKLTGVAGTIPAQVTVTKRDGSSKTERLDEVLWRGEGAMICTIATQASSSYGGSGYRPMRGCSDCRRAGTMCKQCRFDEYDN